MATNVLRPWGGGGGRLLVKGAVSDELDHTGQVVGLHHKHHIPQATLSLIFFDSIPPGKPFRTRFTFVSRFNLVQVLYEAFVDST